MDDPRPGIGSLFDLVAPVYDAVGVDYFSAFGRTLVDDLAIAPGERVLDVGCGRGAALFPLAERVGPTGRVTGIDLSPEMVARTAADARERHLDNVEVTVMDAQKPSLPAASYDVVSVAFVVYFLAEPAAALRAWRDLLVEGGRLGLTTFAQVDEQWKVLDEIWAPYVPAEWQGRRDAAKDPFTWSGGVEGVLRDAGYRDARSTERTHEVRFRDLDQWYAWSQSQGQRLFWERMRDDRERVRADAYRRLTDISEPDGSLLLRQGVRYTIATR